MDVFAIEKGKALKLSVDEFEKQTCHDYPYYRTNKDKRLSLYAICPECGKVHDRDLNAARNILKEGLKSIEPTERGG